MIGVLLLLILSSQTNATMSDLRALLNQAESQAHSVVRMEGSFVSVQYLRRLIRQETINPSNVHHLIDQVSLIETHANEQINPSNVHHLIDQVSLIETHANEQTSQLREQVTTRKVEVGQQWKNPLSGAFHDGVTLPYFNGYACATAVMPGPEGKCIRDKGVGKALLGCTGKPDDELLKATPSRYASKHCSCTSCGNMNTWSVLSSGQKPGQIIWTPFCHTRGFNTCGCYLVDMSIKDKKTCYDLW